MNLDTDTARLAYSMNFWIQCLIAKHPLIEPKNNPISIGVDLPLVPLVLFFQGLVYIFPDECGWTFRIVKCTA